MDNILTKKIWLFLTVLLAAVILFFSLFFGIKSGKLLAQSAIISGNAVSLNKGLQFFYKDQNRFPTAVEFSNNNIMLDYFSIFPAADFASESCPNSFAYKRNSLQEFQLNFCLPKAFQNYSAGWNSIQGSPDFES